MTTTTSCSKCGNSMDATSSFCATCGDKQTSGDVISPDSGVTAWVLCIFLGFLGAHRFYVGKIGTALLMLFTFGGLGIWFVYDYYSIPCRNFTDSKGRYLEFKRNNAFPTIMAALTALGVLFYVTIITVAVAVGYKDMKLENVVKDQITAIQTNNINDAYSYEASDTVSASDFQDFVKQHPEFSNNKDIKFPTSKFNDSDSKYAKLEAVLISANGDKTIVHYEFKKQGKEWKIVKTEVVPATTAPATTPTPSSSE